MFSLKLLFIKKKKYVGKILSPDYFKTFNF